MHLQRCYLPGVTSNTAADRKGGLMAANIMESTRDTLRKRLDELQPLLTEAEQIEKTLGFMDQSGAGNDGQRRRRGRRPKGEPTRTDEFLQIVRENPGISVTGVAEKMGLKANEKNYLYRIGAELADQGMVKKDGRTYTVTEKTDAPADAPQREADPVPA